MWKEYWFIGLMLCVNGLLDGKRVEGDSKKQGCERTNRNPDRFCTKSCLSDRECCGNRKCLCDGDCGLSCVKTNLKCPKPPKPSNSKRRISNCNLFRSVVTYTCNSPYKLRGSAKRTCRAIGRWDGKSPRCDLDYSPCGVSPANFRARIVGGTASNRGMWPWLIGLYKLNNNLDRVLVCGGALIRKRWVLTAAHCFYYKHPVLGNRQLDDNTGGYFIYVGDHRLSKKERSEQQIQVEEIFVHQNYDDGLLKNDIALVKLKEEVKLTKFVRTVCLPRKLEGDLAVPKKYGIVAGWGATKPLKAGESPKQEHKYSEVLQFSAFTIQSDQLCSNTSAIGIDSDVTFCAGDGKGGNDTCYGDSGAAFVREGKREDKYRWVATGLSSWSEGCAQKDQYGYYTRVFPFIDWIRGIVDGKGRRKK